MKFCKQARLATNPFTYLYSLMFVKSFLCSEIIVCFCETNDLMEKKSQKIIDMFNFFMK